MTSRTVLFASFFVVVFSFNLHAEGIVDSIVKAPIVSDGDVAGRPTDLVVNLNFSDGPLAEFFNPSVPGRSLSMGNSIKVVLPDDFVIDPTFPVSTVFSSETCTPGNVQCNTGIIVQGQPQRPIRPITAGENPSAVYSLTLQEVDGKNAFVHTADVDVVPGLAAPGAGIKQIHLITPGVTNPSAGEYEIEVIAETGEGGAEERGSAFVTIHESTRPSINVVSVFNDGRPNTIYQTAMVGEPTPVPHDFLLWGADNEPLLGVAVNMLSPESAELKIGDDVIGSATIDGPTGGGHRLFTENVFSEAVNAPIFGQPAGRLSSTFEAGSELGEFTVTYSLNDGTSQQMFVNVVPEPSSLGLVLIGIIAGLGYFRQR